MEFGGLEIHTICCVNTLISVVQRGESCFPAIPRAVSVLANRGTAMPQEIGNYVKMKHYGIILLYLQ